MQSASFTSECRDRRSMPCFLGAFFDKITNVCNYISSVLTLTRSIKMASIAELVFLASCFNTNDCLWPGINEERTWIREDGFSYDILNTPSVIKKFNEFYNPLFSSDDVARVFSNVEVEQVRVDSGIKLHCHRQSHVVLVCHSGAAGFYSYFPFGTSGGYTRINHGQVIILTPGTPHGFKRYRTTQDPLCLIGVSYPAIKDNDIEYLAD